MGDLNVTTALLEGEDGKAQPGVEPGSLTDRVSVLTTTLLNHTGPHLSVSLRHPS